MGRGFVESDEQKFAKQVSLLSRTPKRGAGVEGAGEFNIRQEVPTNIGPSLGSPEMSRAKQALGFEHTGIQREIEVLAHNKTQLNSLLSTFGESAPTFLEKQEILKDIKNIEIQISDMKKMQQTLIHTVESSPGRIGRTSRQSTGTNFARISE